MIMFFKWILYLHKSTPKSIAMLMIFHVIDKCDSHWVKLCRIYVDVRCCLYEIYRYFGFYLFPVK